MLIPVLVAAFGVSMVLPVTEKIPTFNVRASCEAVAKIEIADAQGVDACVRDEESARAELEKGWHSFPPAERARCEGETMVGGSPSYVDVLVCLQMARDADAIQNPLQGASKRKKSASQ